MVQVAMTTREVNTDVPIGFVGLGSMGAAMAGRLLDAGNRVYGTGRTRSEADPLVERGLIWRGSPREVAEAADVVFSMVTDAAGLEAVAAGPDGILMGLRPGSVFADMSTVNPSRSRDLAREVRARGSSMADAPVTGAVLAAEEGGLEIFVGGDDATYLRIEPLLRQLGRNVRHVGENGQALMMKLSLNLNLVTQILAFSESVLLAEWGGIDPKLAAEVLASSTIGSPLLRSRGPHLLSPPDEAWFDIELMQKGVALALEQGRALEVPLPSAALANELLIAARALGYGQQDIVTVFDVLARMAGRGKGPGPSPRS
jgi:3-hydroxyisobutyrate dehydrogenase-like beta-hydroxyacid dehydrogenase